MAGAPLDLDEAEQLLEQIGDAPSVPVSPAWFRQALAEIRDGRAAIAEVEREQRSERP